MRQFIMFKLKCYVDCESSTPQYDAYVHARRFTLTARALHPDAKMPHRSVTEMGCEPSRWSFEEVKSASANEKSKFIFVRRAKNAKMECALCRRPSVCNGTSRLRAPGDGEIYVCVEMLNGITLIDARRTHTTAPKRMDKMEISFNHATTKSQYIFISMEYGEWRWTVNTAGVRQLSTRRYIESGNILCNKLLFPWCFSICQRQSTTQMHRENGIYYYIPN